MDGHPLEDLDAPRTVIPFGDTWRYEASGVDPGAGWNTVGVSFDLRLDLTPGR